MRGLGFVLSRYAGLMRLQRGPPVGRWARLLVVAIVLCLGALGGKPEVQSDYLYGSAGTGHPSGRN